MFVPSRESFLILTYSSTRRRPNNFDKSRVCRSIASAAIRSYSRIAYRAQLGIFSDNTALPVKALSRARAAPACAALYPPGSALNTSSENQTGLALSTLGTPLIAYR